MGEGERSISGSAGASPSQAGPPEAVFGHPLSEKRLDFSDQLKQPGCSLLLPSGRIPAPGGESNSPLSDSSPQLDRSLPRQQGFFAFHRALAGAVGCDHSAPYITFPGPSSEKKATLQELTIRAGSSACLFSSFRQYTGHGWSGVQSQRVPAPIGTRVCLRDFPPLVRPRALAERAFYAARITAPSGPSGDGGPRPQRLAGALGYRHGP